MPTLRSALILTHRYLGIPLSVLFVLWFVTGIAMIYVGGMPTLSAQARLERLPALDLAAVRYAPAAAAAPGGTPAPDANVPRGTDGLPLAPVTNTVPTGPVLAIHYVAGEGYGEGFAGNAHRHAPDAWLAAMKYAVEELKQDVNARDNTGMTALHHAAARGDTDMILYLVSKGADVTAVSVRGQTVADLANSPTSRISPLPIVVSLLQALGSNNSHKCTQC